MLRPQGYVNITYDGCHDVFDPVQRFSKNDIEHDVAMCGHCNRIDLIPPGCQPADLCKGCMRFLCERCYALYVGGGGCRPFEKRIDAYEKSARGR